MASGHVNRTNRPNTWPHRQVCDVKKVLANPEPSTHGTRRLSRNVRIHGEYWGLHCMSPVVADFVASLFALVIENSPSRRRDFRVKMWGTSSPTINSRATSLT